MGTSTELDRALETIRLLADEVGPRRPTGEGERAAAGVIRDRLSDAGVDARIEAFDGYSTFAQAFGTILGLAVAPALLPRRWRRLRAVLSTASVAALITEGSLRWMPLSAVLSRRSSQNVVATIEAAAEAERTLCLIGHLDTSRSGLLFHPGLVRWLAAWIDAQTAAVAVQAAEPLLRRLRPGRLFVGAARALLAAGLGLLAERELRGSDTPGANDNASGTAVCVELARRIAAEPLERTRVVVLLTGCEESGLLGAQAFLGSHHTGGWLFLNFDNVGAGELNYLSREGLARKWDADAGLLAVADRVRESHPELDLRRSDSQIGLTYDATAVLAREGRALTLVAAEDGVIPNYHWPTDTAENVEPEAVARALDVGAKLIAAVDRGEADLGV